MSDCYTKPYGVWEAMIARCENPKNKAYCRYGGRGIRVCDRWRQSFRDFHHDVGERPSPRHSLDRIDNDGNYEPGNVRWALPHEQTRNSRVPVINSLGAILIRQMYLRKYGTMRDLAHAFGVYSSVINFVVKHRTWRGAVEDLCAHTA